MAGTEGFEPSKVDLESTVLPIILRSYNLKTHVFEEQLLVKHGSTNVLWSFQTKTGSESEIWTHDFKVMSLDC